MNTIMQMKIPVSIFREGKTYVAYSPVLDLSTSATSFSLVQKRFGEVARVFIEELIKMGTLDEVLQNLGWKKVNKQWSPPLFISHELTEVSIPLSH